MATARNLPVGQLWGVTINAAGQAQQPDLQVASSDSVNFHNSATFPVRLEFTSTFSPITISPGQTSSPVTPPGRTANFTVNYMVKNANTGVPTGGPYGIEFGTGPIPITIANYNTSPGTVSIPQGGQIQFTSDAAYSVIWSQPNIFSLTSIVVGVNPVATAQIVPAATSVSYSLQPPPPDGTQGGGTVKINS